MYGGEAYNCTFSGNNATSSGGGMYNEKSYEWLVKGNEGHGFSKEKNRLELYKTMDAFLATNL